MGLNISGISLPGLEGKNVIVTGAASGIGCATADLLLRSGARVLGVDRQARGRTSLFLCDVTAPDAPRNIVARALETFGSLHGLANIAGLTIHRPFLETTPDDVRALFALNSTAVYFLCQEAARVMDDPRRCSIVNVSSINAHVGQAPRTAYAGSKGAVLSMSRAMMAALAAKKIRVNTVSPGPIDTPMMDEYVEQTPAEQREALVRSIQEGVVLKRMGTAEEVASVIAFLLSDLSSYVNGADIAVNGGSGQV